MTMRLLPYKILLFLFTLVFVTFYLSGNVLAEPTTETLPHKTDFLTFPYCVNNPVGGSYCGTTWYARASASQRSGYRSALKSSTKNYTHVYLSVTSSNAGHNFYTNPSGFHAILKETVDDGIKPVVWLTSDSGTWKDKPIADIQNDIKNLIQYTSGGVSVDSMVNSYEIGLEANEYWTQAEVNSIANFLDNLTTKPLAMHQTPGRWDYCKGQAWCDYMILQYGFGKTEDQIKTMTTNAINDLGKPVVAGEYNSDETVSGYEQISIRLGNAALTRCAAGFGNGATPGNVIWPSCSGSNTPTPTLRITPTSAPTLVQNQPPFAHNITVTTSQNTQVYIQLTFDDPDGPGPYTYTITQQPVNGTLTGTDNDRYYTPETGFTGTDTFKWKVRDGLADSNIATVTINIAVKPGDANGDGKVNIADYAIWLTNYNKNLSGPTFGDFNSNGKIDGIDFIIWLKNYTG